MSTLPIATRHLRSAVLVTLLAFGGYILLLGGFDAGGALAALGAIPAGVWGVVLLLSLFNYGLRWARWHWLLCDGGNTVLPGRSLAMYMAGFAFTATPAKAGEAVRAAYLRSEGVPVSRTLSLLYLERLLDLVAVGLLAVGAVALWTASLAETILLVAVFLGVIAVLGSRRVAGAIRRFCLRHPGRPGNWLADLLAHVESMLRPRLLAGGVLLGVVAWGAEGVGLALIMWTLGVDVALEIAIGIYAAAMVGGAVTFMPGGLGGAEAVMMAGLVQAGATAGVASAATVICRVATLWFAVGLGALAVLGLTGLPPRPEEGSPP